LLANVDIDGPLAKARGPSCSYYMTAYRNAAESAQQSGDVNGAAVYGFLQAITSFHPSFDTPTEPFESWFQMGGKRGLIPSDMSPDDIEVIRKLTKLTKDPELRSRLFDVLWELTNDHKACAEAANSYVESAERLNIPEQWVRAAICYRRGLYLAAKLGRGKELFKKSAESLLNAIRNSPTDTEQFRCCQYLKLAVRMRCGDFVELAAIASGHAQRAAEGGNFDASRPYREVEADLHKLVKNEAEEKAARLAGAEASVSEAEQRAEGPGASLMAAATLLSQSIEALRRGGATKERIEELRPKLKDWQQKSLAELKTLSSETDISELVSRAREHVSHTGLRQAILKLAFGQGLSNPKKLEEEVLKTAKKSPLAYSMNTVVVDDQGRTTAQKEGLLNLKGQALEQALEAESFSHASRFNWPLRVEAFIEPARVQILNDHKPNFSDLFFIVRNNPFIPPGHEGIFLRGLHAGFHGDFLVASHLLTPQIENSFRYVLESKGVDVSDLNSNGTQTVKVLGGIFGLPQTKQILGEDLCFELRGSLIEKSGYGFRDRVAHGFVHEAECYSPAGVTVWWLVLRICLTPIFQAIKNTPEQSPLQENETNAPNPDEEK
ncbi:MAG: DUF4209 domain-containing protein, partial [Verrucomicrobiota bacterium]|nr:DUF4209 domain-containing protein [Verrucomicrobiota bacterium]